MISTFLPYIFCITFIIPNLFQLRVDSVELITPNIVPNNSAGISVGITCNALPTDEGDIIPPEEAWANSLRVLLSDLFDKPIETPRLL